MLNLFDDCKNKMFLKYFVLKKVYANIFQKKNPIDFDVLSACAAHFMTLFINNGAERSLSFYSHDHWLSN